MPTPYQQPGTSMLDPLPEGVIAGSPEYNKYLTKRYALDTEPGYKLASRNMRSYIRSSRGLRDSGIEGAYAAGLGQQQQQDVNRFAADLGQGSAQQAYQDKVRKQAHDWMVEDEGRRMAEARTIREQARELQRQQANNALWGNILSSAGSIVGSYYGGPVGGAVGGAAGSYAAGAMNPNTDLDQTQMSLDELGQYEPMLDSGYGTPNYFQ